MLRLNFVIINFVTEPFSPPVVGHACCPKRRTGLLSVTHSCAQSAEPDSLLLSTVVTQAQIYIPYCGPKMRCCPKYKTIFSAFSGHSCGHSAEQDSLLSATAIAHSAESDSLLLTAVVARAQNYISCRCPQYRIDLPVMSPAGNQLKS